jgi:hypothetical protein
MSSISLDGKLNKSWSKNARFEAFLDKNKANHVIQRPLVSPLLAFFFASLEFWRVIKWIGLHLKILIYRIQTHPV